MLSAIVLCAVDRRITSLKAQKKGGFLTLKVQIDAQWEGMGDVGRQGMSRHYFPHARP